MTNISPQTNPNLQELHHMFETSFLATDSDLQTFDAANDQTLSEWFDISQLPAYLPHSILLEAREQDQLIGAILVGKQNILLWPDGHKAEIFILGVLPNYQGQGIGKQLLSQAEQAIKAQGARSIITNSHIDLPRSHQFYLSQGYTQIGILKDYYDNGDAVFFSKSL